MSVILSFVINSAQEAVAKEVAAISMPVFYATDRQRDGGNLEPVYNQKRRYAGGIEYGECQVTLPSDIDPKPFFSLGWMKKSLRKDKPIVSEVKSEARDEKTFWEDVNKRLNGAKRLIVFTHGYNNGLDVALTRSADLALVFKSPVITYSWPSNGKTLDYMKDECNIEWSLMHFRKFLDALDEHIDPARITFVAHSMGNRLLMWGLEYRAELKKAKNETTTKYPDIVLTSPDVDSGTFKNYAENVCSSADESWVLMSTKDRALKASRVVHGRNRLGSSTTDNVDVDWRQPPTIPGLTTIEFTAVDKGWIGHSIHPPLIERLADRGIGNADDDPIKLQKETDGKYTWYRVLTEKEKRRANLSP